MSGPALRLSLPITDLASLRAGRYRLEVDVIASRGIRPTSSRALEVSDSKPE